MRAFNINKGVCKGYLPILMLLTLFLSSSINGIAQQQVKSDYEIQQEFNRQYSNLNAELNEADSSAAVDSLVGEIKTLEETYAEHKDLLNVALYPETFSGKMEDLKQRALSEQNQITTIEEQEEKLQELGQQVTSYDSRLDSLNNQTDSLRRAIQKSVNSEEQLTGMVRRYRKSLEQRDELILSFVDSVMITYQQLNVESMQDLENAKKKARFDADGNALKMILNIANENITLLNSEHDLTTEEYLRMSSVQQEFKTMWNKVGDKLVEIYAEGDQEKAKKNISEAIAKWDEKVTTETWTSINASFDSADIQLPQFTDNETFYQTLDSYLSEAIKSSKDGGTENSLTNYQNFSEFWTQQVQTEWTPHMIDANVLGNQQMASIDQQLEQWAANAEPGSNNMLVYLLGLSILAIVALGVMLAREKKGTKE